MCIASQKAAELLSELQINEAPVPVEPLIEKLDLMVLERDLKGEFLGIYRRGKHRSFAILQQGLYMAQRRRITVHECGHYLFHTGNQFCIPDKFWVSKQERQAEMFAAYYLIPGIALKRFAGATLCEIAEELMVPEDLVRLRGQKCEKL